MKQITQWSIINDKEDKLEFNHIEDGWSCRDKPLGIYVNQKKEMEESKVA